MIILLEFMDRSSWIIVLVVAIVAVLGVGLFMWVRPLDSLGLTQESNVPGSSSAQREGTTTSRNPYDVSGSGSTGTSGSGSGSGSSGGTSAPQSSPAPLMADVFVQGDAFEPAEVHIAQGGTVVFRNGNAEIAIHPASDPHPSHDAYPGSNANLCGTPDAYKAFDSCRDLGFSDSWSFVFGEKGRWSYHDHLNPSVKGVIVVE